MQIAMLSFPGILLSSIISDSICVRSLQSHRWLQCVPKKLLRMRLVRTTFPFISSFSKYFLAFILLFHNISLRLGARTLSGSILPVLWRTPGTLTMQPAPCLPTLRVPLQSPEVRHPPQSYCVKLSSAKLSLICNGRVFVNISGSAGYELNDTNQVTPTLFKINLRAKQPVSQIIKVR